MMIRPFDRRTPRLGRSRLLAVLAAAALTTGLGAIVESPAALAYPFSQGSLGVADAHGPASASTQGDTLTLSGGGFAPGATVTITIESTPRLLRTVATDGSGSFQTTVVVPADMPPGAHTLKASGASPSGGLIVLAKALQIGASDAVPLPSTGAQISVSVVIGAGLVAVGLAVLLARRRRRRITGV
jgi:LPXTG-motif cell wall-anchored protein